MADQTKKVTETLASLEQSVEISSSLFLAELRVPQMTPTEAIRRAQQATAEREPLRQQLLQYYAASGCDQYIDVIAEHLSREDYRFLDRNAARFIQFIGPDMYGYNLDASIRGYKEHHETGNSHVITERRTIQVLVEPDGSLLIGRISVPRSVWEADRQPIDQAFREVWNAPPEYGTYQAYCGDSTDNIVA